MRADLHSHSIYSDGYSTPKELVAHAKKNGINVLALTDHDSVLGVKEFLECSSENFICLAGIEVSTKYNGDPVHIVGLFKGNNVPQGMYDFSTNLLEDRKKRAIEMALNINRIYGTNIDIDLLKKECKTITRKNIMNHLYNHCNVDYKLAEEYAGCKSPAYVRMKRLSVDEGIDLIHKNNGIAILAHPCLISKENLDYVLSRDFDGIEAKYAHKDNDYEYFKRVADLRGFFISAGSDYHGDSSHGDIGDVYLEEGEIKLILNKLGLL